MFLIVIPLMFFHTKLLYKGNLISQLTVESSLEVCGVARFYIKETVGYFFILFLDILTIKQKIYLFRHIFIQANQYPRRIGV